MFVSADLSEVKLVGKDWKISVKANESITLKLSPTKDPETHKYITIGDKKSCEIKGKL